MKKKHTFNYKPAKREEKGTTIFGFVSLSKHTYFSEHFIFQHSFLTFSTNMDPLGNWPRDSFCTFLFFESVTCVENLLKSMSEIVPYTINRALFEGTAIYLGVQNHRGRYQVHSLVSIMHSYK